MEYTYQNQDLELSFETSGSKSVNPSQESWEIDSLQVYRDGRDVTDVVNRLDRMQAGRVRNTILSDIINEIYSA